MAGDMGHVIAHEGRYQDFLIRRCTNFERVFLILGNNDYKGIAAPVDETIAMARSFDENPKIHGRLSILEKDGFDMYDGSAGRVSLLGCTLWSDVPEGAKENVNAASNIRYHDSIYENSLKA